MSASVRGIRLATVRDVDQLVAIEEVQFPEPWSKRMLKEEILNLATRRYTVVVEAKKVLGVLGLMFIDDECHVNTIATCPGYEGQGIARSLLDEAWPVIVEKKCRRITLEVAVSNERARRLYGHYGFMPLGIRKKYYQKTGEDALVLVVELNG